MDERVPYPGSKYSIMAKFLRPGKVVVVLNGRFAGKKAVIVKNKSSVQFFMIKWCGWMSEWVSELTWVLEKKFKYLYAHLHFRLHPFNPTHLHPSIHKCIPFSFHFYQDDLLFCHLWYFSFLNFQWTNLSNLKFFLLLFIHISMKVKSLWIRTLVVPWLLELKRLPWRFPSRWELSASLVVLTWSPSSRSSTTTTSCPLVTPWILNSRMSPWRLSRMPLPRRKSRRPSVRPSKRNTRPVKTSGSSKSCVSKQADLWVCEKV